MISRFSASAFVLIMSATLPAGCAPGESAGLGMRTDSAGVEIVRHPAADRAARLALREEFRRGGSETRAEESFYQLPPGSVGVDAAGNVHVLDRPSSQVVTFDADGRFVRTVGRAGGGPGEFGMAFGLVVAPDGTIGVIDVSKRGLVRFDPDGAILPIAPFPHNYFGGRMHDDGEALIAPVQLRSDDGTSAANALVRIAADDTIRLAVMPVVDMQPLDLSSCGMRFSGMPPVFTPTLRWSAAGSRVAIARSAEYDVEIYESGRLIARIRRDVEPVSATRALAIEEQGDGMRVMAAGGERVCEPREVVEQRGVASHVPAVGQLALATDGTLWVQRGGSRDQPRAIDLFSSTGDYLGTLPPGTPFPLAFLPDGRIAAPETDEYDVTRLVVYRLEAAG